MTLSKASDSKILELKERGMSLRQIASGLGLSHEAVRKRLKSIEGKDRVSTNPEDRRLTAAPTKNKKLSTASDASKSRTCEKSEVVVNQVSTKNAPSQTTTEGGNSLETPPDKLPEHPECMKGVFQGVLSEVDSLSEQIKQFLESKGIEIYRMQVGQEAYQVNHKGQIIRLYVQRNKEETG